MRLFWELSDKPPSDCRPCTQCRDGSNYKGVRPRSFEQKVCLNCGAEDLLKHSSWGGNIAPESDNSDTPCDQTNNDKNDLKLPRQCRVNFVVAVSASSHTYSGLALA